MYVKESHDFYNKSKMDEFVSVRSSNSALLKAICSRSLV